MQEIRINTLRRTSSKIQTIITYKNNIKRLK